MKRSENEKVQGFLDKIKETDSLSYQILQALRKIVFEHYPQISERIMYGGIMLSLKEDVGGLFACKKHVSFEFGAGYLFEDPDQLLEGGGKFRRHLKFRSPEDIQLKKVIFFVRQMGA